MATECVGERGGASGGSYKQKKARAKARLTSEKSAKGTSAFSTRLALESKFRYQIYIIERARE